VKRRYFGAAVIIVAVTAGVFGVTSPVVAADATSQVESIAISPVSRDYKVDAGKELSDELTIINDGKVAYDFIIYSRPYSVQSERYEPDFTKIKITYFITLPKAIHNRIRNTQAEAYFIPVCKISFTDSHSEPSAKVTFPKASESHAST